MRVIAGTAKGRRLYAPKGMETRPITAKIKEALFNIWQDRISGSDFLDLFAEAGVLELKHSAVVRIMWYLWIKAAKQWKRSRKIWKSADSVPVMIFIRMMCSGG